MVRDSVVGRRQALAKCAYQFISEDRPAGREGGEVLLDRRGRGTLLGEQSIDFSRSQRMGKIVVIAVNGEARQLHDPVMHQRRDRDNAAAVAKSLPHLDRRSHGCFGCICDDQVVLAAHLDVPHKNLPRPVSIVSNRSGVVGKGIVDFGTGPVRLHEVAKGFSIGLIVHQSRHVRALHDPSQKDAHDTFLQNKFFHSINHQACSQRTKKNSAPQA